MVFISAYHTHSPPFLPEPQGSLQGQIQEKEYYSKLCFENMYKQELHTSFDYLQFKLSAG